MKWTVVLHTLCDYEPGTYAGTFRVLAMTRDEAERVALALYKAKYREEWPGSSGPWYDSYETVVFKGHHKEV